MSKVWYFLRLEDSPTEGVFKNVDNVIDGVAMHQQTKELLDEFYRPYNQLLAHVLSDVRYLWNDISG